MKRNIKIIGFDFDGTLVDNKGNLKTDVSKLFHFLKENGFLISIVTGKGLYFIKDFLKKYGLNIDYIISYDGASIYNFKKNIFIKNNFIEEEKIEKIIKITEENNINNIFFNKKNGYQYLKENLKKTSLLFNYTKKFDGNFKDIYQIYIRNISEDEKIDIQNSIKIFFDLYFFNFNGKKNRFSFLITQKNINKYNSFLFLLKEKNIKENEVIYFGDSINDLEFFKNKKILSVAVSNAVEILKERSSYNMKDNNFISIIKKYAKI